MNREAAALGVPVYSIFRSTIGAVDKYLENNNRLTLLKNNDDIKEKINLKKWNRPNWLVEGKSETLCTIVCNIEKAINGKIP